MSDLLSIGASGLSAYRSAMATVSDNVANAETPGYTRRSQTLVESPSAGALETSTQRGRATGGGVDTGAVTRAWDAFQTGEARIASADASRADAKSRWLTTTEAALDDGDTGVGAQLTSFFGAGNALAGSPNDATKRAAMLSALGDATSAIRTGAKALSRASDGIAAEAQTTASAINGDLASLRQVNLALQRAGAGTAAAASLADQRDGLIDSLSASLGATATLDGTGAATLGVGGATILAPAAGAGSVQIAEAADGRLSASVTGNDGKVQALSAGGTLGGLTDVAAGVASRRTQLNGIAADFTATVNGWQAKGTTPAGAPGAALLTLSGGAETLVLAVSDPGAIAAARSGAANGNLLALSDLRGANGVEARFAALVSQHAQATASAKAEASATATRRDSAASARDAVSGVDLDREAADLLRYQQAYDASAKIVQAARETLTTILNLF